VTRYTDGPADSPGFLLWRTTLRWQRAVSASLAPLGLTHVQFVLLACAWWLNNEGHAPNQLGIAAQAAVDVKMTSEVLRKLESKGLIARGVDENDARARTVTITERGRALAMQSIAAVEQVDAEFFGDVSAAFVRGLHRLAGLGPNDGHRGPAAQPAP